jgi:galactokinase
LLWVCVRAGGSLAPWAWLGHLRWLSVSFVFELGGAGGALLDELCDAFEGRFGRRPEAAARAPGRVNLIGEHTDYNEGWVLPCAIDRATVAAVARRSDGRVRVLACDLDEEAEFDVAALLLQRGFVDYVQGVVFALAGRGVAVPGFDLALASDVPRESGLSSSAALEVAVVTALDSLLGLELDAVERAWLAHRAESGFVGVACGIMDQFASALGQRDRALRLDCRHLALEPVPLPPDLRLLLAESGVKRALVAGAYGDRRAECEAAFEAAAEAGVPAHGARALRDLSERDLPALERVLEPLLLRRARHVILENARVHGVCEALGRGDLSRVGALLDEGMRSLRDDFEVSTPELDHLCRRAEGHPAVYGSRLTGAGFGGCTLHLVPADAAEDVASWIADGFEARFGRRPPVHNVVASDGAQHIEP